MTTEETYKKYLSTNYHLLYRLVEQKLPVICFIDITTKVGIYREMCTCASINKFGNTYLSFMDEESATQQKFISFCEKDNVTFIRPHSVAKKKELVDNFKFKIREKISDKLLNTKLIDTNLSVRALNALRSGDIITIGDLLYFIKEITGKNDNDFHTTFEREILRWRNFGITSLIELKGILLNLKVIEKT